MAQENAIQLSMNELDNIQKETTALSNSAARSFSDAYKYALVAQRVMNALTVEVLTVALLPLRNKDFGWREDTPGKYQLDQLRDVFTSAILYGALPTNNEILIISGRFYPQKNFFTRKLAEYPGLTELVLKPSKVNLNPQGALVEYTATWNYKGQVMSMERTGASAIPVRLNQGQGADAALGKAERKMKAAIYNQLSGSTFAEGEAEDMVDVGSGKFVGGGVVVEDVTEAQPKLEAPAPTQTEVVKSKLVENVKKTKPPETVTAAPAEKPQPEPVEPSDAPWVTAKDEPIATKTTPVAAAPQTEKPVGWVKNPTTGAMDPVASGGKKIEPKPQAATAAAPAATAAAAPPVSKNTPKFETPLSGDGEVHSSGGFAITAIRAGANKQPPYRVVSETNVEYWTMDKGVATKASELKSKNAPVEIDFVIDAEQYNIIVDVRAADFGSGDDIANDDGQPAE